MDELRVVLDTDFINGITEYKDGDPQSLFCRIFQALKKIPVVHPYVAAHELTYNTVARGLIEESKIQVIPYSAFFPPSGYKYQMYDATFRDIFNQLRGARRVAGKDVFRELGPHENITDRHAGMSFGEIHSILMAVELGIPLFFSNDSDSQVVAHRYPEGRLRVLNAKEVAELLKVNGSEVTAKERKFIGSYYRRKQ